MPVLLRISLRNLLEHKSKSLILGTIIAVGVMILVLGNSLMNTASLGIQQGFINNYTSHIMISGLAEGEVSLFGVQSPGGIEETPTIPNYDRIKEWLDTQDGVEVVTSQITGYAGMRVGEYEGGSFTILFGIEPKGYRSMFDNVSFIAGRDLYPGEEGLVMSVERIEDLENSIKEEYEKETGEELEFALSPGDSVRLTSFGNVGIKIREVPLIGIFEFKHKSNGLGIDLISYVDVQTLRALSGLTVGYQGDFDLLENETMLLNTSDLDDLFSEELSIETAEISDQFEEQSLDTILGSTEERDTALQVDTGSWNYFLIKMLHPRPRRIQKLIASMNQWFADNGILAQAVDWEGAAGPFAKTADIIRTVFNIAIIIVGIVALIIMMNTLVISVIERTSEIGTMRALGAQKGFVWKMFFLETLTITTVFGIAGIVLAAAIVLILDLIGIPATNVFLRILFAGDTLKPSISPISLLTSLLIAVGIGFVAHLYPISVALKIPPIRAIQTE